MLTLFAISTFTDNYIWCLCDCERAECIVVDPGDAAPVIKILNERGLKCVAILLTHHHFDHIGGVAELYERYQMPIYGPHSLAIPMVTYALSDQEIIDFPDFNLRFTVLTIPGHTLDHIAYYDGTHLFCGDTLFAAGCGRLFEGTPVQMVHSLHRLMQLPDDTQVYCAHEYTLKNLQFSHWVAPHNQAVINRLAEVTQQRSQEMITLPSTIALEKATNPFLRVMTPEVLEFLSTLAGHPMHDHIEAFARLRQLKDQF
jgi:hydroxyacylglutathione hydrolase